MHKIRKSLGRLTEILVFLLVLTVFVFSLYKILTIAKVIDPVVFGVSCDFCDCSGCEGGCDWCWPGEPTPTPEGEPTPTPTPTESVTPTPTESVSPTPTETITPTPTSGPSGDGGESAGGGPSEPGLPGPPVCGYPTPSIPTLLSVISSGTDQVLLTWTAVSPVTHYSISYGLSSGSYIYGVDNTGNVTSFTVGGLDPGADYCFAVRAVNDCAPSGLSNEICTGVTTSGQVLGVSTLADTGSFVDDLLLVLFIIASGCFSLGLRLLLPAKKLA